MNKLKNFKKSILVALVLCVNTTQLNAQDVLSPAIGIETAHLLDLFEGETKLANGYTDIDLKGMGGTNTQFDIGYGLKMEIPLKVGSSIVLNMMNGRLTSQKENQYAEIKLSMIGLNYRHYLNTKKYLLKSSNPDLFKARAFVQLGFGTTNYKGKRFFERDNGLFSSIGGTTANTSSAFGYSFEFGKHFQVETNSNFILIFSDAVDGYDNGKKTDIMLKTGIGLMYHLY